MKRKSDELAASVKGRDDSEFLRPTELELVRDGAGEAAEFARFADRLRDEVHALATLMADCRTVGQARAVLAKLDDVSEMLDRV
jgi:hypothetical protein